VTSAKGDISILSQSEVLRTATQIHVIALGIRDQVVRGRRRLPSNGTAIVAEARAHLETATRRKRAKELLPNEFWAKCHSVIQTDMPGLVTMEDVLLYLTDCFNINVINHQLQGYVDLYYQTLEAEFPEFKDLIATMECSPYLRPNRLVSFNGKLVSSGFIAHLRAFLACLTWTGKPRIVCEIGGGYGGLALLWMTNPRHNPDLYILIDFPESLFFPEVFLRANQPKARVLYIDSADPLDPSVSRDYDYIFCPSDCVGALARLHLDLVVNMYSFQEMSDGGLEYWMDWLERQDCRFLYSLQIFGLPLVKTKTYCIDSALWAPRLRNHWDARVLNMNPNPMLQFGVPVAEMVVEKRSATSSDAIGHNNVPTSPDGRFLSLQQLLEELNDIRRETDEARILAFLRRWAHPREDAPREVYAVAEILNSTASAEFRARHGAELDNIREMYARILAAS